jgi:TfoX/Sxy family transcriptional regulator of competence genes
VPYDEELANRVRELLADERAVSEMPMFGGLAFLLHGNMSVAVSSQGGLLVRVGPQESDTAARRPHASVMQMGKRQMTGWIRVAPEGVKTKRELDVWVRRGVGFARTLPPKGGNRKPRRRA